MKRSLLALVALFAVALCGCTVVPMQHAVVVRPMVAQNPDVVVVDELDYVGDSTPLAVVGYSVPFYPRYVIECDCIIPVAFIAGYWINSYGVRVVYHGGWRRPPPHVHEAYRQSIRSNPHQIQRYHHEVRPPERHDTHQHAPAQQHVPQATPPARVVTPQPRVPQTHVPAPTQHQGHPQAERPHVVHPQHAPQQPPKKPE